MPVVGYFTAEIGLWSELHTYSGGLGVLAGDHVKSAADAGIPLVGVTLLYHQGPLDLEPLTGLVAWNPRG